MVGHNSRTAWLPGPDTDSQLGIGGRLDRPTCAAALGR
jgi:hypothetical protein